MRYIEAAARIKTERSAVRDEWRKQDVIDKAARRAKEVDFPEEVVRKVYEELVEGSIAHEMKKWDAMREGDEDDDEYEGSDEDDEEEEEQKKKEEGNKKA